ncbi:hypothetical protein FMA36_17860 (plasmid) [Komagataeibacter xylinus]|uniref:Uncharacterized protein n=2 Tax=Komagataeibacter xylinus TaxID=28448 RepID=A0A857FTG9_KOMXY|nr:hypothetical protein FMA36_17860 [Komagataeibacter xylinus]
MSGRLSSAYGKETHELICPGVQAGIMLTVFGTFNGYPHSALHDAVVRGIACPRGETQLRAFEKIGVPPPHLRINVEHPAGQGLTGAVSVTLFWRGRLILGERKNLSLLAKTRAPSIVSSDINVMTDRLWHDLAELDRATGSAKAVGP